MKIKNKRIRPTSHNANTYKYQLIRGIERKLYLIDLRGGKCQICGYDKNLAAFDFHHKNPKQKEGVLNMRQMSNATMESVLKEFDKYDVLCANCHREKHSPKLNIEIIRGRVSEFKNSINKTVKEKNKCVDCGKLIFYRAKRCVKCFSMSRQSENKPKTDELIVEFKQKGYLWCAKKYGVSDKTIYKWIKEKQKNKA